MKRSRYRRGLQTRKREKLRLIRNKSKRLKLKRKSEKGSLKKNCRESTANFCWGIKNLLIKLEKETLEKRRNFMKP